MNFGYIVKLFENHSVCVTGMKGSGKDLLMANVIEARGGYNCSNVPYNSKTVPIKLSALDCGGATFKRLSEGVETSWEYPYPYGVDIYISDVGVYMPSQYCSELNRLYPCLPTFMQLSRQIANIRVHTNTQNLGRCWDKIRELSDCYLYCEWCKYLPCNIVVQSVIEYDKASSCQDRVKPCRVRSPSIFQPPEVRENLAMYHDKFFNTYGTVRRHILVYINNSTYDTNYFRTLLNVTYKEED